MKQRISGVEASESEFNDLYNHVKNACSSSCGKDEINSVASHLQTIIGRIRSNVYMVKQVAETRWHRFILRSVFGKDMFK